MRRAGDHTDPLPGQASNICRRHLFWIRTAKRPTVRRKGDVKSSRIERRAIILIPDRMASASPFSIAADRLLPGFHHEFAFELELAEIASATATLSPVNAIGVAIAERRKGIVGDEANQGMSRTGGSAGRDRLAECGTGNTASLSAAWSMHRQPPREPAAHEHVRRRMVTMNQDVPHAESGSAGLTSSGGIHSAPSRTGKSLRSGRPVPCAGDLPRRMLRSMSATPSRVQPQRRSS